MAAETFAPLVVMTEACGYVATHIIKQLLEAGYKVRGTLHSLLDEEKVKQLSELCPKAAHELDLVELDLTKEESIEEAVRGAKYVIHNTGPLVRVQPKCESDVVQPAVDGTQRILKVCSAARSVERVVLTSSFVAVNGGGSSSDKTYTEDDWSDDTTADAYVKSRILAEKAAWDFVKELSGDDKMELSVINPGYVMGPILPGSQCTSLDVMKRLMERSLPLCAKLNFPVVDVRDVAAAHLKALTMPAAAGNRHLVVTANIWMKEIGQILCEEFRQQGYGVPTATLPSLALRVKALFDKSTRSVLPLLNKVQRFDDHRMKSVLGVDPIDVKRTVIEMAYSLIENGLIKRTKKYKPPVSIEPKHDAEDREETEEEKMKGNGDVPVEIKNTEGVADEVAMSDAVVHSGELAEGDREEQKSVEDCAGLMKGGVDTED